jgi:hypothetical protein
VYVLRHCTRVPECAALAIPVGGAVHHRAVSQLKALGGSSRDCGLQAVRRAADTDISRWLGSCWAGGYVGAFLRNMDIFSVRDFYSITVFSLMRFPRVDTGMALRSVRVKPLPSPSGIQRRLAYRRPRLIPSEGWRNPA